MSASKYLVQQLRIQVCTINSYWAKAPTKSSSRYDLSQANTSEQPRTTNTGCAKTSSLCFLRNSNRAVGLIQISRQRLSFNHRCLLELCSPNTWAILAASSNRDLDCLKWRLTIQVMPRNSSNNNKKRDKVSQIQIARKTTSKCRMISRQRARLK